MGISKIERLILVGWLLLAVVFGVGCSDTGGSGPQADDDQPVTELENQIECQSGVQRCDPDRLQVAQVCADNHWEDRADCSAQGKICENGDCLYGADADLEEEEEVDPGPTVLSTSPHADEVVPGTLLNIDIVFSRPVWTHPNVATRNLVTVETYGERESYLNDWIDQAGTIDYQGQERPLNRQLRLTLINPLISGAVYTVTIKGGDIFDEDGLEFSGYEFQFTVQGQPPADMDVEEVEDLLPEVEYTDPADGSFVSLDQDYVLVAFSEPMKIYAFDLEDDLTWKGNDGTTMVFSADWQDDHRSLSMMLDASNWLQEGVTYTIRLEEGLMDEDNNELGSYSFSFTAKTDLTDGDEEEEEAVAELEPEQEEEIEVPIPEMGVLESVQSPGSDCIEDFPFDTSHALHAYWSNGKVIVHHIGDSYPDAICMSTPRFEFDQQQNQLEILEVVTVDECSSGYCKRQFVYTIGSLFPASYTITLETRLGDRLSDTVVVPHNVTAITNHTASASGESTQFVANSTGFDAVHQGREYNTGLWELYVDMQIDGDTITLDEIPVYSRWNRSSSPLKVTTEIRDLASSTYTVVYRYEGTEIHRDQVVVSSSTF